jgi:hypothetical protein
MASLTKRGKTWSLVFKKRVGGRSVRKTYALGTKYKKVAKHKQTEYEKLYEKGIINPFDDHWNLKEFEESRKSTDTSFKTDHIYLEDLKKEFLRTKSHTSDHNLRAYRSILKLFKEHVGQTMPAKHIKPSDIRSFCFQDRLSNATQRNYLKYLKTFFKWLTEEDIIETNPCEKIRPPKKKDKIVDKIIREHQLKTIF